MPQLLNDFSTLSDKHRFAITSVFLNNNIIPKGMKEAGYKDTNDQQLKIAYKRLMKREDAQSYLRYIENNPAFLEEEMNWFKRIPAVSKTIKDAIIPAQLTEENKNFLENYFLNGDKFRAMVISFPDQYNESNRAVALHKASRILANQSSIEYMNMLNERSLQELFLTKSKIIKEVYLLAKECNDSKSRFAAVKAYELLARMAGLLQDNKSVNVNDGGKIEINYIVPDKIDTSLHQDINAFLKEGVKDVEFEQYQSDQEVH